MIRWVTYPPHFATDPKFVVWLGVNIEIAHITRSTVDSLRTCVGCRERAPRSSLVRLVADRAAPVTTVVVDPGASAPGRGAWLHPQLSCLDRATTRRAMARALRQPVSTGADQVVEWFAKNITPAPLSSNKRAGQKPMGTR